MRTTQEKKYNRYILNHMINVLIVWDSIRDNIGLSEDMIHDIYSLIRCHDESKFDVTEYSHCQQYFYPKEGEESQKEFFEIGWNHHQKSNPHHWQYWIMWKPDGSVALEMPLKYIVEMLCDCTAMSLNFNDTPTQYFEKHKDFMLLHENTFKVVEKLLPEFEKTLKILKE